MHARINLQIKNSQLINVFNYTVCLLIWGELDWTMRHHGRSFSASPL